MALKPYLGRLPATTAESEVTTLLTGTKTGEEIAQPCCDLPMPDLGRVIEQELDL